jgi:hypothetical protein
MKYALLIYPGPARDAYDALDEDQQAAYVREYVELAQESGVLASEQLAPGEIATTVRWQEGKPLVTDGPFANTKEVLGGFYLVEADSLDGALDVAARMPAIRYGGAIEVHRVVER